MSAAYVIAGKYLYLRIFIATDTDIATGETVFTINNEFFNKLPRIDIPIVGNQGNNMPSVGLIVGVNGVFTANGFTIPGNIVLLGYAFVPLD